VGEELNRLVHVSPGRGPADPNPGRELRECLALAQVREHEQGLPPGFSFRQPGPTSFRRRRIVPAA
jgi:hypothetical protein